MGPKLQSIIVASSVLLQGETAAGMRKCFCGKAFLFLFPSLLPSGGSRRRFGLGCSLKGRWVWNGLETPYFNFERFLEGGGRGPRKVV
jgi:hypothetical protein